MANLLILPKADDLKRHPTQIEDKADCLTIGQYVSKVQIPVHMQAILQRFHLKDAPISFIFVLRFFNVFGYIIHVPCRTKLKKM